MGAGPPAFVCSPSPRPFAVASLEGETDGGSRQFQTNITLGVTQHFGTGPQFDSAWELRPEFRVENAYRPGITPYDNGTKSHQTSVGIDAIFFYGNP